MSNMRMIMESGFFAHNGGPRIDAPRDWIAWHFTLLDYLPEIIAEDALCCDDDVPVRPGSVADPGIKNMRRLKVIAAANYPLGRTVSAHVPFYFAAKSPMLYRVKKTFDREVLDRLVFVGVTVGDAMDAGATWAASDGNAAAGLTRFSTNLDGLGIFVDFELLKAQDWYNTPDDPDRRRRRAAEFLIHDRVPLALVSQVVARNDVTLELTHKVLSEAGYTDIEYRTTDVFFN